MEKISQWILDVAVNTTPAMNKHAGRQFGLSRDTYSKDP